jgi:hypothetical protein
MPKLLSLAAVLIPLTGVPAHSASVALDTKGAEAWIACTEAGKPAADCNSASAITDGGVLAELAIPTFGKLPDEHPINPPAGDVKALADAMKRWPLDALTGEIATFFPTLGAHTAHVYVVGSGAYDWADAYVRNYRFEAGKPVLDDNGEPVILINLRLMARYKGTTAERANIVRDILRHELFHIHFAWARAANTRWAARLPLTPGEDLMLSVEDEGIAHFLASEDKWRGNGFPRARADKALADLTAAVEAVAAGKASDALLLAANQGPFWDKYASISGALFAYGIDKVYGSAGLKACIEQGPAAFILKYGDAARSDSSLPPLPPTLQHWAERARIRMTF